MPKKGLIATKESKEEKVSKHVLKKPKLEISGKPSIEMISYSIKMVIPTGQFANIQPEIIVKAATPDEAHDYIAPHMNKMWKEYFLVNERVNIAGPEVPTVKNTAPVAPPTPTVTPVTPPVVEAPPSTNVAVIKATQAINSCSSLEALDLIKNQVDLSVKLSEQEKPALRALITNKLNELNADALAKRNGI